QRAQRVLEIGQFHFDGIEDALRALALVVEHDRLRAAPPIAAARPSGLPAVATLSRLPEGPLAEREARQLLEAYGLRLAPERLVATPADAASAAAAPGFPVP